MANTYRASFNPNLSNVQNSSTRPYIKPPTSFYVFQPRPAVPSAYQNAEFDGKRLRKAVARKTVDYNSSIVKMLESRVWQRDYRDSRNIQPDNAYYTQILPPMYMLDNPANCITTKFVRTSTNKMRCPIFCVLWTPEGRRLVTGASSGEFTLWNGLTFNFETILQAHDSAVKVMVWSRNDSWMVTADQTGYVKYWQSNMNNVKMFQAHKEPVRAISFCPTDTKFATCSDDGTIRIWDFLRCFEERILRGHGADVKGVDWHPTKALIASGSKDSQQPVKLWDPKSGQSLATLHAHKNTVTDIKWNQNGNWLLTASRDHLIKIFDIRNMSSDMQTFRGHKKEVSCLAWHPIHEGLFTSGGSDGSILFWLVGTEKEIGCMEQAHDSIVWSLSWHPLGHILTSGSNDHSCKFWTRNRPGDRMRDKYNLNLLPKEIDEAEYEEDVTSLAIPGMGFGEKSNQAEEDDPSAAASATTTSTIPGLGFDRTEEDTSDSYNRNSNNYNNSYKERKVPFSKPIPKQFQQQWNSDSKQNSSNGRNDNFYSQPSSNSYDNFQQYSNFQQPPQPNNYSNQSNNQQNAEYFPNQSQFAPPVNAMSHSQSQQQNYFNGNNQYQNPSQSNSSYSDYNSVATDTSFQQGSTNGSNSSYQNSNPNYYSNQMNSSDSYSQPYGNQQNFPNNNNHHNFNNHHQFPQQHPPSHGYNDSSDHSLPYEQQNYNSSKRIRS